MAHRYDGLVDGGDRPRTEPAAEETRPFILLPAQRPLQGSDAATPPRRCKHVDLWNRFGVEAVANPEDQLGLDPRWPGFAFKHAGALGDQLWLGLGRVRSRCCGEVPNAVGHAIRHPATGEHEPPVRTSDKTEAKRVSLASVSSGGDEARADDN